MKNGKLASNKFFDLESVGGSLVQAHGRVEFMDG